MVALSNYLSVLAAEVAGEVAAYKRSSRAAHFAYLEAGRKLADARESARRGEWLPFLEACGIGHGAAVPDSRRAAGEGGDRGVATGAAGSGLTDTFRADAGVCATAARTARGRCRTPAADGVAA